MTLNEDIILSSDTYYFLVAKDGSNTENYNVKISDSSTPTSVKLNTTSLTLGVDESYGLIKTILPSNANQSCAWPSSNSSVASVNSNGKVTAKKQVQLTVP